MITQKICPKYPCPVKFSDPGGDFADEELKELIRETDGELTETDLMCIFQGALPAGEYHEVMYFLPIALQHIVENQENDTLDNYFGLIDQIWADFSVEISSLYMELVSAEYNKLFLNNEKNKKLPLYFLQREFCFISGR